LSGDIQLIRRAKQGDIAAFEELIMEYQKKVYNTAYRFFNNAEDALDVSQEIFIKVYTSLKAFKEGSTFSTWLYRIAVNTCIDYSRKRRKIQDVSLDDEDSNVAKNMVSPQLPPDKIVENREIKDAIAKAIQTLPEDLRICIILRDIQGFTYLEISELLDCSIGTVKSRINRGRRALRKQLQLWNIFSKLTSKK